MKTFLKNLAVRSAGVFVLFFIIFFLIHASVDGFQSWDDPYYHAKHSWLMQKSGDWDLVQPWLRLHFLSFVPTDPWWGFHVVQGVFIKFFGIIWGTKIFVSILAAVAMSSFYFLLEKFRAARPFLWTFLLFSSSFWFEFRLILERPLLLAMIFIPMSYWLITEKKYYLLFISSLVYALAYNLAPLIVFSVFVYAAVEFYFERKIDLKLFISSVGGILAGILIHPYSLGYVYVMSVHFLKVIFLQLVGVNLGIGEEVRVHELGDFFSSNFIVIVFYIVASALFFVMREQNIFVDGKEKKVFYFLFSVSVFWMTIGLFVPRAVEYSLPAAWFFIALILTKFSKSKGFSLLSDKIREKTKWPIIKFYFLFFFALLIANNYLNLVETVGSRSEEVMKIDNSFKNANEYLKKETNAGDVIFYDDWSLWPQMFFANDYNRYIGGMDPTFTYDYDPGSFWIWRNISNKGIYCDRQDVCSELSARVETRLAVLAIKKIFEANFVITENNKETPFLEFLNNNRDDFRRVFDDGNLLVYRVVR